MLDAFQRDGYLVMPSVFDADEVRCMGEEADFILELVINSSLCNDRQSGRLDIRQTASRQLIVRKIQPIIDLSLVLAKFSNDARLLGPMEQFMGDTPVLMEEKLNYKQPVSVGHDFRVPPDDDRFPIHNDWAYYKMNGYPSSIISSALTIDESLHDNGPIQVYPGSHRQHVEHDRVRNGLEVPVGTVRREDAVPILAPAGSVMFFHSQLIHTSTPNTTSGSRRMMIYSHYPAAARMGIDVRNGPNRLRESPWEWEYRRRRDAGRYVDAFRVDATG
tara:strand:- start:1629 stop:2453 length:825 start_codon:yes stop_codon:yes gene_type:complete